MTYAVSAEVEFPAVRDRERIIVRRVSSIKIETSWKNLTDTATVVLPRKVRDFDRMAVGDMFQDGDPIIIRYGYNGELNVEFEGYLSQVSTYVPVVLTCEDEMYKLKRKTVSVSREKCTLKQLLTAVAPGYKIQCDDMSVGSVRYDSKLVTEIFDDLKQKMQLHTYFKGKTLVCGITSIGDGSLVDVVIERQAENSLKDKSVGKIWVRVESLQHYQRKTAGKKQPKKLFATKGEKDGNKITIRQPNLTQVEIDKIADNIYTKAKQPGLDGDLILFGIPHIEHGMTAKLSSILYPERNGMYYIDSVVKELEISKGVRQTAKLGNKTT